MEEERETHGFASIRTLIYVFGGEPRGLEVACKTPKSGRLSVMVRTNGGKGRSIYEGAKP